MNLVCYFYSLSKAGKEATLRQIGDEVDGYRHLEYDALRQQFNRDRKALAARGFYIECEQNRYYLSDRSRPLPKIDFASDEKIALATMIRALEKGRGLLFEEDVRTAALKIALKSKIIGGRDEPDVSISLFHLADERESELLDLVTTAINRRKRIQFEYQAPTEPQPGTRTVEPYALFFREGNIYLVARSSGKRPHVYRFDRMRDARFVSEGDGAEYEIPEDFDVATFAERKPWQYEEKKPTVVRVWFSPAVAHLARRQFDESRVVGEGPEGIVIELDVTSPRRFLRAILAYGAEARILEPASLVDDVMKRLDVLEQGL